MDDDHDELLHTVTGLKGETPLTEEHHEEATRLLEDPTVPKSDLRGKRDLEDKPPL
jgi:hypothetical protein